MKKKGIISRIVAFLLVLNMLSIDAYADNGTADLGANPEYTVQYYAEVEELVTKNKKTSNNDLAVVDTAKKGKLPTNKSVEETYITLDASGKPKKL